MATSFSATAVLRFSSGGRWREHTRRRVLRFHALLLDRCSATGVLGLLLATSGLLLSPSPASLVKIAPAPSASTVGSCHIIPLLLPCRDTANRVPTLNRHVTRSFVKVT